MSCGKAKDDDRLTDFDGNKYETVILGTQEWMAENLKTTSLNDGSPLAYVPDDDEWDGYLFFEDSVISNRDSYCWYENNRTVALSKKYGALYNWLAVATEKLCPAGWHVSTDEEWNTLVDYISQEGYTDSEAMALKTVIGWNKNATEGNIEGDFYNGNDTYGFSAVPGGHRSPDGLFHNAGDGGAGGQTFWWTASVKNPGVPVFRYIRDGSGTVGSDEMIYHAGMSIRCVKDQTE